MSKNCLTFPPAAVSFNGFVRTRGCVLKWHLTHPTCVKKKKAGRINVNGAKFKIY